MFVQIVNRLTLPIFLFVQLTAYKQVLADDAPRPPPSIASTNVSTVLAGNAFTLKCAMPNNFTIGNKIFQIYFYNNITEAYFSYYVIRGKQ